MKSILLEHYKRYPKMQIQDMTKLIYQNEFAGGHLIKNSNESLSRLINELNELDNTSPLSSFMFEDIGNGLCRLHLAKCNEQGISTETINRLFVSTANTFYGSIINYEEKLNVLRKCCSEELLPYDINILNDYITNQKEKGYQLVSHSATYKNEYSPHYRIVKKAYCDFIEVFRRIDELLEVQDKVIVAIEGRSSAGKSTLSAIIGDTYDCNIFHMDDFFLSPEQKTQERLNQPGGNVDYKRFYNEVISPLQNENTFSYKPYDCKTGTLGNPIQVTPKKLAIIEGVYSMHPTLIDRYDLTVFMDIDDESQSARILKRNGAYMHERFQNEWIPLENKYFDCMAIRKKSDLYYNVTNLNCNNS